MAYTDEQILKMDKVTPAIAASYLKINPQTLRDGLIQGIFPFGLAMVTNGSQRTCFDIRPQALVEYNRHGMIGQSSLEKVINKLNEMEELIYDRYHR